MSHNAETILKQHMLKVTVARKAILDAFTHEHKPMNADDIAKKIKDSKTDLATIYRTLELFEKKSILKRIDLRKESVFYELAYHHHHHLVCTSCGAIEDFEACSIGKMLSSIVLHSRKFNIITDHSLELFGLCNKCVKS